MKQVREMSAARQIDAYVVMKGDIEIAVVHIYWGSNNNVLANIFTKREGLTWEKWSNTDACALSGATIDGYKLVDHCEEKLDALVESFTSEYVAPKGFYLSNWDDTTGVFRSCYKLPGLQYLEALGYTVIKAI